MLQGGHLTKRTTQPDIGMTAPTSALKIPLKVSSSPLGPQDGIIGQIVAGIVHGAKDNDGRLSENDTVGPGLRVGNPYD